MLWWAIPEAQLNDLTFILQKVTNNSTWEFGLHLSDSTFLYHNDTSLAALEAIKIWRCCFLHNEYELDIPPMMFGFEYFPNEIDYGFLSCFPRGCIATGDVHLIPGLKWREKKGFVRTERVVLLKSSDIGSPKTIKLELSPQDKDLVVTAIPTSGEQKIKRVCFKRHNQDEEILGLSAIDPGQKMSLLHIGEFSNIAGTAVVQAVRCAENSGLKGPRLLLTGQINLSKDVLKYVQKVPNSDLKELLWTADYENPSRSILFFSKAMALLINNLDLSPAILLHYEALLCLCIQGLALTLQSKGRQNDLIKYLFPVIIKLLQSWYCEKDKDSLLATAATAIVTLNRYCNWQLAYVQPYLGSEVNKEINPNMSYWKKLAFKALEPQQ